MKIHKIDEKRIYFIMDSGACGSISRKDIGKLVRCHNHLKEEKTDPRTSICLSIKAGNIQAEEMITYLEEL